MTVLGILAIIDQVIPIGTLIFNFFKNRAKTKHVVQTSTVQSNGGGVIG